MQVGKIQNQAQFNRNSQSLFLLKRSDNSSTHGSIQVNFSPIPLNQNHPNSLDVQKQVLKSYPIFNTDKKHFTPCFILQVDKALYTENSQIYYSLHVKKIQELCQQKEIIFVPRPSMNSSFCCICKTVFDDYLTHVTYPEHKRLLQNCQFTHQIKRFCQKLSCDLMPSSAKLQNCQEASVPKKTLIKQKKIIKTAKAPKTCQKAQNKKTKSKR